jgi:hypothetical protein
LENVLNDIMKNKMKKIIRIFGILLIIASFILGTGSIILHRLLENAHAAADSEVGTFAHGFSAYISAVYMDIGIFIGSTFWGLGIGKRKGSVPAKKLEGIIQRIFFYGSVFLPIFLILFFLI